MLEVIDPHRKDLTIEEAEEALQQARANGLSGPMAIRIPGLPSLTALDTDKEGNIIMITDTDSPRTQQPRP